MRVRQLVDICCERGRIGNVHGKSCIMVLWVDWGWRGREGLGLDF